MGCSAPERGTNRQATAKRRSFRAAQLPGELAWSSAPRPRKLGRFGGSFLEVDPGFQRDPETVGDPVGIGEVGDDLHEIEDVPIAEALKAKTLDIAPR